NNTFQAFTANDLTDYELYIYDRQGILVFSGFTPEMSWNGTYKGHDCPPGTYVYIAKYRRAGVDRLMSQKGTVTLLR
ncbi:MAG: gliding motility-associated C-terminal domain-containing protein, partial [Bacteroidales bacterium]|nr:gliding motility-associated C-terminal domain-containing protein [Bacteroidales bacterium]